MCSIFYLLPNRQTLVYKAKAYNKDTTETARKSTESKPSSPVDRLSQLASASRVEQLMLEVKKGEQEEKLTGGSGGRGGVAVHAFGIGRCVVAIAFYTFELR